MIILRLRRLKVRWVFLSGSRFSWSKNKLRESVPRDDSRFLSDAMMSRDDYRIARGSEITTADETQS